MNESGSSAKLTWWALVGTLTGLAALGTLLVRVPIPATTGYFNIGDTFVMWAGLWLGPMAGLIVGAVGPTLADAIGYPVYIPATMVTKGTEGLLVGLIAAGASGSVRRVFAVTVGGLTIVAGYFAFQAIIYPWVGESIPFFAVTTPAAAVVELIPNVGQAVLSAIAALTLASATRAGSNAVAPET